MLNDERIKGAVFLIPNGFASNQLLMEQSASKAKLFGKTEWFFPGGKREGGEDEFATVERELREELGIRVDPSNSPALPVIDCAPTPTGFIYLVRPFFIRRWRGYIPTRTLDQGVPLQWFNINDILRSPLPQIRAMAAMAMHMMPVDPPTPEQIEEAFLG